MPEPDWARPEEVWAENPEKNMEILGIGPQARKSKTFIESSRAAYILSRIRTHRRMLFEMLRRSHARHHQRPVYRENEDGDRVQIGLEPEWLSDEEILAKYSSARAWHEAHQEVVEHNVSVKALSVHAVSHLPDEEAKRRGGESSAAKETPKPNERW